MTVRHLLALAAACTLFGTRASAQTVSSLRGVAPWGIIDAVGYGGVGLAAGYLFAALETDDLAPTDVGIAAITVSTISGVVGGALLGRRARARIASGRPVSAGHRLAVTTGAVFAGATLGAGAAFPLINPEDEGTPLGSDEFTLMVAVGGGTVLGILYAMRHQRDFDATRVSVAPYVGRRGGTGLQMRVRF